MKLLISSIPSHPIRNVVTIAAIRVIVFALKLNENQKKSASSLQARNVDNKKVQKQNNDDIPVQQDSILLHIQYRYYSGTVCC